MKKNLSLLKRLGILSILCFSLVFVATSSNLQASASARPCCSSCEVFPGDDEFSYCENYCGSTSNACYNNCLNRVRSCWRICLIGC